MACSLWCVQNKESEAQREQERLEDESSVCQSGSDIEVSSLREEFWKLVEPWLFLCSMQFVSWDKSVNINGLNRIVTLEQNPVGSGTDVYSVFQ